MLLKNAPELRWKQSAEVIPDSDQKNFKHRKEEDRAKLLICSPLLQRPDWKVSPTLVCHCDQAHSFVVLSVNW